MMGFAAIKRIAPPLQRHPTARRSPGSRCEDGDHGLTLFDAVVADDARHGWG